MKAQLPSRTAASASAALATTMRRFGRWGLAGVALFGGGHLLCRPRASASVLHGKRDVELARAIGNHPVGLHALFVIVAHAAPQVHRLERAPRKDGAAAAARVGASPPLVVPLRLPATIRARRAALHDRATRVVEKVAEEERFVGGPRRGGVRGRLAGAWALLHRSPRQSASGSSPGACARCAGRRTSHHRRVPPTKGHAARRFAAWPRRVADVAAPSRWSG